MLDQEPRRPMGEWLILDEAHAIKNRESRTYHSILTLRLQFDSCLMMTCTPLDNNFLPFQAAFLQSLPSGPDFPEGFHRERYIQMLDACSLRRPQTTIEQEFPMLDRKRIVIFALDPEDRRRSNNAYNMFKKSRKPGGRGGKLAGWKYLIQAQQYACHPMLVELKFERAALVRAMYLNEAMDTIEEGDQAATDQLVRTAARVQWAARSHQKAFDHQEGF
ncbi:hypothetical protein FOVG_03970 [Fusarium oxysporum f. sp. pisi HDV247]|uniref:Helicase ATP-binding domain-containing protein n=1 Tax=Fusarium oxysporum f. sp. pisi HDV247 TaxID=1080344 RepID=W9PWF9_FUSOX|nr:hypothetical protein FOVG_03970 [Fusarium oxysporum f. sp. pisi HDV247]